MTKFNREKIISLLPDSDPRVTTPTAQSTVRHQVLSPEIQQEKLYHLTEQASHEGFLQLWLTLGRSVLGFLTCRVTNHSGHLNS